METKRCPNCGETKTVSEFHKSINEKDGLNFWCKLCAIANTHRYYQKNSEKKREYSRKYRQEKAELVYEYNKKYNETHSDHVKEYLRNWHEEHADEQNQRASKWQKEHPEAVRIRRHTRRSRIKGNGGKFTETQWNALVVYYYHDGKCLACKTFRKPSVDHVIPLKLGGTNNPSNLQPICRNCNSKKHVTEIDYRPDGGTYAKWIEENIK